MILLLYTSVFIFPVDVMYKFTYTAKSIYLYNGETEKMLEI